MKKIEDTIDGVNKLMLERILALSEIVQGAQVLRDEKEEIAFHKEWMHIRMELQRLLRE